MLLIGLLGPVGGCAEPAIPKTSVDPSARVELVSGTTRNQVVLTARAVERLGIRTAPVTVLGEPSGGPVRWTVPYGAILYDAKGTTLVYTNTEPSVFINEPVVVESVEDQTATLVQGPPAGTSVVTVGTVELFGIEFGVGK